MNSTGATSAVRPATRALRAAVEQALSQASGRQRRIAWLERRPSSMSSSYALEELTVGLDDGELLRLIFKDLSWQARLDAADGAKPDFLYDPLREIETYRGILAADSMGTAACYGAHVDPDLGRYWLFLEHVEGSQLRFVGLSGWSDAARWLARMHRRYLCSCDRIPEPSAAHLLHYDGDFYRRWMYRAQALLRRYLDDDPRINTRSLACLAERHARVVERLVALPGTMIHGEFYASNVLVEEAADNPRLCPVDWEMAGIGPGLLDLAALTAGNWTSADRAAVVEVYYRTLASAPDAPIPERFSTDLECCRFQLAIQWLGWSESWSPPAEHAHDWLDEALGLADRLAL